MEEAVRGIDPLAVGTASDAGSKLGLVSVVRFYADYLAILDVEFEQAGKARAEYGTALIERLSKDLTARFGHGFGAVNLSQMKKFYLLWPAEQIFQTPYEKSQTVSAGSNLRAIAPCFPLP